jgi:DNA-binding IclR family transcriptional regulator
VLAEEQKMATVYLLHNKTRLKREDIKSNLDDLVRLGWVNQTRYANVMYSINMENPYVSKLVAFLREVGYVGQ